MSVARFEELVERAATRSDVDPEEARRAILAWFEGIREALLIEHAQPVPGLGTLKLKRREPYEVRNPRTGETIRVPARFTLRFSETAEMSRTLTEKFALPLSHPDGTVEAPDESPAPGESLADKKAARSVDLPAANPPSESKNTASGILFDDEGSMPRPEDTRLGEMEKAILDNLPGALPDPPPPPPPQGENAVKPAETPVPASPGQPGGPAGSMPNPVDKALPSVPDEPKAEDLHEAAPVAKSEPRETPERRSFPPPTEEADLAFPTRESIFRIRPIIEGVLVGLLIAVLLIVFVVLPYKRGREPIRVKDVYLSTPTVRPDSAAEGRALRVAVRKGDTLASLAARHYGDARLWIFLWVDNQSTLAGPDSLSPVRDQILVTGRTNGEPARLYLRLLKERMGDSPARRMEWLQTAFELDAALVRANRDALLPRERKKLGL